MKTNNIGNRKQAGALLLALGVVVPTLAVPPAQVGAQAGGFADPAFKRVWDRTDAPVAQAKANRTWLWGPTPGHILDEPFAEGRGGVHLVQYFDKARMEINDPSASPGNPFFVTNGLLVTEMISGKVQKGVRDFEDIGANDARIAGDDGSDTPSYGALRTVASVGLPGPDHRVPAVAVGSYLSPLYIDRAGQVQPLPASMQRDNFKMAAYSSETGHNIPDVFWDYMNSQGTVLENGAYKTGLLMNWTTALGYPVTEAYWTNITVQGRRYPVFFQAFQRRVLTYSPNNPAGWKVEMGNVGLQYYEWRYESALYCSSTPVRGFGKVWAEHHNVQRGVGCPITYPPYDKEEAIQTSYQPFEHGVMLWVSMADPRAYAPLSRPIYVFFDDGTFQQFADTWQPGDPPNAGLTPPSGLYEPQQAFGKLWREGTGARIRDRLGWAAQPQKEGPGAYQRFDRGEMFWTATANKIFALYGTTTNDNYPTPTPSPGALQHRYDIYDDTFSP